MSKDADGYLKKESEVLEFSPRAIASCLKVARTIADMEKSDDIKLVHIKEAVVLRKCEGGFEM